MRDDDELTCSFCGAGGRNVALFSKGRGEARICEDCVERARDVLGAAREAARKEREESDQAVVNK